MQASSTAVSRSAETPPGSWLSVHLFLPPAEPAAIPSSGDRLLAEVVRPIVRRAAAEGWSGRFFFIRYQELGPHLRLRLQGEADVLAARLRPFLSAALRLAATPEVDEAGERFDSDLEGLSHVRFLPYEPEVDRYGGVAALALAEELFHASSEAALDLLEAGRLAEESSRSLQALFAMTVLVHAFGPGREESCALARRYGEGGRRLLPAQPGETGAEARWERIFRLRAEHQPASLRATLEAWWEAMEEGGDLPPPFAAYRARLAEGARRLRRLHSTAGLRFGGSRPATFEGAALLAAPSYLHMMSNRLGISVLEEAFLGSYLAGRLADPDTAGSREAEEAVAWSR